MSDADAVCIGGRYRLERQLAAGGMGTVWLAWDLSLRRQVAVKRVHLRPGLTAAQRDEAVARTMREGRITARLQHPNAVPVYDVIDDEHGPCLVMQYVPSRSLAAVVDEDGPVPPHEAARIGTQLAAALAAAHHVGIVHRDVKPANVLVGDDGSIKITDFGVSHAVDDASITSTGMVTGTPAYLAPEVARGEPSTAASDVYSLGSTLYHLVEGRPPYGSDPNAMATLHRVATGRPRPVERAGPLRHLLGAMMSAVPADRPDMIAIAARLPDLNPSLVDDRSPDRAVTQALRAIPPSSAAASARSAPPNEPAPGARTPSPPRTRAMPTPADEPVRRPSAEPDASSSRDSRRVVVVLVATVAVVLLGAGLLIALLSGSGDDTVAAGPTSPPTRRNEPTTVPSTTSTAARPSARTSSRATPSSSSVPPRPTPARSAPPRPTGPVTDGQLAAALQAYFRLVPGNLDAAWQRLTPNFQQGRAGGRGTFDSYWGSVRHVDVQGVSGQAPRRASATLTYHYRDGRVVTQRTTLRFVRRDGRLEIDAET